MVTISTNPQVAWTKNHQISLNGKTNDFSKSDLLHVANEMGIRDGERILNQVIEVVSQRPKYAREPLLMSHKPNPSVVFIENYPIDDDGCEI